MGPSVARFQHFNLKLPLKCGLPANSSKACTWTAVLAGSQEDLVFAPQPKATICRSRDVVETTIYADRLTDQFRLPRQSYPIDIRLALPPAAAVLIDVDTSSRSQLRQ